MRGDGDDMFGTKYKLKEKLKKNRDELIKNTKKAIKTRLIQASKDGRCAAYFFDKEFPLDFVREVATEENLEIETVDNHKDVLRITGW